MERFSIAYYINGYASCADKGLNGEARRPLPMKLPHMNLLSDKYMEIMLCFSKIINTSALFVLTISVMPESN